MSVYEWASGIIIPIAVSIFLVYKPEKVQFKLIRHDSPVKEPFESKTALEVFHPDKAIGKCKVIFNGHELICDKTKLTHVTVLAQETAFFRIPSNLEVEDAKVIVKKRKAHY
jgi:hypothetical protein